MILSTLERGKNQDSEKKHKSVIFWRWSWYVFTFHNFSVEQLRLSRSWWWCFFLVFLILCFWLSLVLVGWTSFCRTCFSALQAFCFGPCLFYEKCGVFVAALYTFLSFHLVCVFSCLYSYSQLTIVSQLEHYSFLIKKNMQISLSIAFREEL